jgi:hypothetical protein
MAKSARHTLTLAMKMLSCLDIPKCSVSALLPGRHGPFAIATPRPTCAIIAPGSTITRTRSNCEKLLGRLWADHLDDGLEQSARASGNARHRGRRI